MFFFQVVSSSSFWFVLISKGYCLSLEFCLFVYCLSILSQYDVFDSFDVSNDSSLFVVKRIIQNDLQKNIIILRKSVKKTKKQINFKIT